MLKYLLCLFPSLLFAQSSFLLQIDYGDCVKCNLAISKVINSSRPVKIILPETRRNYHLKRVKEVLSGVPNVHEEALIFEFSQLYFELDSKPGTTIAEVNQSSGELICAWHVLNFDFDKMLDNHKGTAERDTFDLSNLLEEYGGYVLNMKEERVVFLDPVANTVYKYNLVLDSIEWLVDFNKINLDSIYKYTLPERYDVYTEKSKQLKAIFGDKKKLGSANYEGDGAVYGVFSLTDFYKFRGSFVNTKTLFVYTIKNGVLTELTPIDNSKMFKDVMAYSDMDGIYRHNDSLFIRCYWDNYAKKGRSKKALALLVRKGNKWVHEQYVNSFVLPDFIVDNENEAFSVETGGFTSDIYFFGNYPAIFTGGRMVDCGKGENWNADVNYAQLSLGEEDSVRRFFVYGKAIEGGAITLIEFEGDKWYISRMDEKGGYLRAFVSNQAGGAHLSYFISDDGQFGFLDLDRLILVRKRLDGYLSE